MGFGAAFAETFWPLFTAAGSVVVALGASAHVVLYKRDSRAAVAWVGLIWLVPFLGSVLYVLLGINRVRRRVSGRRGHESAHVGSLESFYCEEERAASLLPEDREYLIEMVRLGRAITGLNLLKNNTVEPLVDGDEAYPAMLEAIDRAERSVTLSVYIFDNDAVGRRFLEALTRAVGRGVEVRVLVDAVGARYSMPPITGELIARGVRTARFMSGVLTWRTPYLNLRNHRKICVIDGVTAFTGGMNIRGGHVLSERPAHPTRDVHFRVTGPVVQQLQATFVEDWLFTTGELLSGELWFPPPRPGTGTVCARVVPDGPDHHMDRMSMAFQGALAVARHSVRIVTPYFLPERALIAALNTCALRGVTVDIVLPRLSNLRMVSWAAMAQMWQILEWGCRVWLAPPPFDHSKLMVVDDTLSLIGSSNWDPRSLRLNFELGVECYDADLARRLDALVDERIAGAERLTRAEADGRPLAVKLRDGLVRLAAPYL